jgi:enterochelin esterase family protein
MSIPKQLATEARSKSSVTPLSQVAAAGFLAMLATTAQPSLGATPPVRSPEVAPDRMVTFRLRAPYAKQVTVAGGFGRDKVVLNKDGEGVWFATVGPVAPGVHEYSFTVDGLRMLDPANPHTKPQRAPVTSILEVPGTPALLTAYQDVPHGIVHVHHYRSRALGGELRRLHVYTPPGYDTPGRAAAPRYPVLYLLHGRGDNDATWTVHGRSHFILDNLIARGQAKPMIVVMTDGHALAPEAAGASGNVPPENTVAYGKDLLGDVIPLVEARYRTRSDSRSRALVGLSMGGNQALRVGLANADKFAWIGAFSAAAPTEADLAEALADSGALNRKLAWLWIACGKDDFLIERNRTLVALLEKKGVAHRWTLTEGDHSWPVWRTYLQEIVPQLFVAGTRRR